ncbi:hypothetical protein ACFQ60_19735 [Streptomyces zhihengii]
MAWRSGCGRRGGAPRRWAAGTVAGARRGGADGHGRAPGDRPRPGERRGRGPCAGRLAKSVSFSSGELRVYRSGQQVCAVTLARNPGIRRTMSVSLQARGGRAEVDEGRFSRQAGPVTVAPRGRCVRATGAVSGISRSTGWILC